MQVAVVVAGLLLAFFVARSCQQAQIQVDKERAIEIAEEEVDFTPRSTQVRLLRQGLDRTPFWFVSLGVPLGGGEEGFSQLAVVKIDANTGKVESVEHGKPVPDEDQDGSGTGAEAEP
jgi:hypothetical protein